MAQLDLVGVHAARAVLRLDHQAVLRFSDQALHRVHGAPDQRLDDEGLGEHRHPVGFDLGQVEHVADHAEQVARGVVDLAQVVEHVAHAGVLHLLLEHLAVADHGRERRAQFVAHVGDELALGEVGLLGLLLGALQLDLDALAVADIGMSADPFDQVADVVEHRGAAGGHVAPLAVVAAHAVLDLVQAALGDRVLPGGHGVGRSSGWMASSQPSPAASAMVWPVNSRQRLVSPINTPPELARQTICDVACTSER